MFKQLIEGFCYIESKGVIHRDIRENNILIDKAGIVKIIDFGIGKIFDAEVTKQEDSLLADINRANSDTLPQEYYEGIYTYQTDMFYLAELFNRMLDKVDPMFLEFSYRNILDKMMKKNPQERYKSFMEVKNALGESDFANMQISQEDKDIYTDFANQLFNAISRFTSQPEFVTDPDVFVQRLEEVISHNLFEEHIQYTPEIIKCVVLSGYKYYPREVILCETVQKFFKWLKDVNSEKRSIIVTNLITKLRNIEVSYELDELPFA